MALASCWILYFAAFVPGRGVSDLESILPRPRTALRKGRGMWMGLVFSWRSFSHLHSSLHTSRIYSISKCFSNLIMPSDKPDCIPRQQRVEYLINASDDRFRD